VVDVRVEFEIPNRVPEDGAEGLEIAPAAEAVLVVVAVASVSTAITIGVALILVRNIETIVELVVDAVPITIAQVGARHGGMCRREQQGGDED